MQHLAQVLQVDACHLAVPPLLALLLPPLVAPVRIILLREPLRPKPAAVAAASASMGRRLGRESVGHGTWAGVARFVATCAACSGRCQVLLVLGLGHRLAARHEGTHSHRRSRRSMQRRIHHLAWLDTHLTKARTQGPATGVGVVCVDAVGCGTSHAVGGGGATGCGLTTTGGVDVRGVDAGH